MTVRRLHGAALAGLAVGLAAAALALALPSAARNPYTIRVGFITAIYVVLASAWNILGGYAGQVSFGFAVFYGLGAYTTAILIKEAGAPAPAALPAGAAVAAVASLFIGYPTFRLRGPYFAIATIGVGEAFRVVMLNWESVTGGSSGYTIPLAGRFDPVPHYYAAVALAVVTVAVSAWVRASRFGLALLAVKSDEDAARAVGVNATAAKLAAHAVAAALVGLAGGIFARYVAYINPTGVFGFGTSITMLLMPVIGGVGTVWGPVLGAVIYGVVQDYLLASFPNLHLLLYGGLLVVIVMFEPGGLLGLVARAGRFARRRFGPTAPAAAPGAPAEGGSGGYPASGGSPGGEGPRVGRAGATRPSPAVRKAGIRP